TGISEQVSLFPQKCELTAHPNPFNRACRITLADNDSWRVKIFDLSGRLVHDFGEISGKSVMWSPGDDVKSGVYVVVAEGERAYTRGKVVYIK
ncbi:MAG TPA: T9SS type A sorting domain-containing protein, partial [Candidatus Marinimicrobia bacterium]|nr:T9SS type A sorting domain-containing protein [Candidatus Neomarinimicrobiota bacterium]